MTSVVPKNRHCWTQKEQHSFLDLQLKQKLPDASTLMTENPNCLLDPQQLPQLFKTKLLAVAKGIPTKTIVDVFHAWSKGFFVFSKKQDNIIVEWYKTDRNHLFALCNADATTEDDKKTPLECIVRFERMLLASEVEIMLTVIESLPLGSNGRHNWDVVSAAFNQRKDKDRPTKSPDQCQHWYSSKGCSLMGQRKKQSSEDKAKRNQSVQKSRQKQKDVDALQFLVGSGDGVPLGGGGLDMSAHRHANGGDGLPGSFFGRGDVSSDHQANSSGGGGNASSFGSFGSGGDHVDIYACGGGGGMPTGQGAFGGGGGGAPFGSHADMGAYPGASAGDGHIVGTGMAPLRSHGGVGGPAVGFGGGMPTIGPYGGGGLMNRQDQERAVADYQDLTRHFVGDDVSGAWARRTVSNQTNRNFRVQQTHSLFSQMQHQCAHHEQQDRDTANFLLQLNMNHQQGIPFNQGVGSLMAGMSLSASAPGSRSCSPEPISDLRRQTSADSPYITRLASPPPTRNNGTGAHVPAPTYQGQMGGGLGGHDGHYDSHQNQTEGGNGNGPNLNP